MCRCACVPAISRMAGKHDLKNRAALPSLNFRTNSHLIPVLRPSRRIVSLLLSSQCDGQVALGIRIGFRIRIQHRRDTAFAAVCATASEQHHRRHSKGRPMRARETFGAVLAIPLLVNEARANVNSLVLPFKRPLPAGAPSVGRASHLDGVFASLTNGLPISAPVGASQARPERAELLSLPRS